MNEYEYEYDCMKCIYGSLSLDDFPCDVCYAGDMYEPEEGSENHERID